MDIIKKRWMAPSILVQDSNGELTLKHVMDKGHGGGRGGGMGGVGGGGGGIELSDMDKYTAGIELSNACRSYYAQRLKTAEGMKKKLRLPLTTSPEQLSSSSSIASLSTSSITSSPLKTSSITPSLLLAKFPQKQKTSSLISSNGLKHSHTSSSSSSSSVKTAREEGKDSEDFDEGYITQRHPSHHQARKCTSIDNAMNTLRSAMASLIDQDLALMRQLLTLNERIEELKWQRKYSSNMSYSSELSRDSSMDAGSSRSSTVFLSASAYALGSGSGGGGSSDVPGNQILQGLQDSRDMLSKYPSPSMLSVLSGFDRSTTSLVGSQDWDHDDTKIKDIEDQGDSTSDLGSSTELTSSSNSIKRAKSSAGNSDTLNSTLTNSSQDEEGEAVVVGTAEAETDVDQYDPEMEDPDPDYESKDPDYESKIHNHEPLMYELEEYQTLHQKHESEQLQKQRRPIPVFSAPPPPPLGSESPGSTDPDEDPDYPDEFEDRFDIRKHVMDTKAEVQDLLSMNNFGVAGAVGKVPSDPDPELDCSVPHPEDTHGGDILCQNTLKAFDMLLEGEDYDDSEQDSNYDDNEKEYSSYRKSSVAGDVVNNNNNSGGAESAYDLEICIPPPSLTGTDDELEAEDPYHELDIQ